MEVRFRNRRLERSHATRAAAIREWGFDVGQRYIERIELLFAVDRVRELYDYQALDFHPLTGDRRGQFAIRLTGRMRLILTVEHEDRVMIEEVVDYHG